MVDLLDVKMRECYQQNNENGPFSVNDTFCKLIFDGIMCWPATKPGIVASQPCPDYFKHVNTKEFATKECEENGEWYIGTEINKKWTNYSQCWKFYDQETALIDIDTELSSHFMSVYES